MPFIAVDGVVFNPPDGDAYDDCFLETLTGLEDVHHGDFLSLLVPDTIYSRLCETGIPPWKFNDSRRDVGTLLIRLIERSRSLEDWSQVNEIILTDVDADPDTHLRERPQGWQEYYHQYCSRLAIAANYITSLEHPFPIYTIGTDGTAAVEVSGVIQAIDCTWPIVPPEPYNELIQHCDSRSGLKDVFDPLELWKQHRYRAAISLHAQQRYPDQFEQWYVDDLDYTIKREFIDSLDHHGFTTIDSRIRALLRSISDTIAAEVQDRTRPLRTDEGGGAPQLQRSGDGAAAWRRDVDDEYRLHYWRTTDCVELALLVGHDEFHIPE